ncbi:hypothetical protein SYNPS1DRAFT_26604 [Syncephalis pseudoplumigaleata]|uniref:Uncharacterized protein n=1 Tax=Syncephalis pseudoplumigaleata TaxID=1712513 RepID=A0A4V1J293_9FUNG|nr:hypothetical protein SYNPS1DRAFT_26604 [Syncephalis pseudoplumigaleata]|eukprot:RKP27759.1 hypothetical protein SYNPS1DRAFT_26604 [Syncephalis pseudoplumigaleata]
MLAQSMYPLAAVASSLMVLAASAETASAYVPLPPPHFLRTYTPSPIGPVGHDRAAGTFYGQQLHADNAFGMQGLRITKARSDGYTNRAVGNYFSHRVKIKCGDVTNRPLGLQYLEKLGYYREWRDSEIQLAETRTGAGSSSYLVIFTHPSTFQPILDHSGSHQAAARQTLVDFYSQNRRYFSPPLTEEGVEQRVDHILVFSKPPMLGDTVQHSSLRTTKHGPSPLGKHAVIGAWTRA